MREDGTKQMSYAAMLALGSDDAAATRTPPDELRRRFEAQAAREAENYRAQRLEREAQHAAAAARMRDIAASINAKVDERMQAPPPSSVRPSRMQAPPPQPGRPSHSQGPSVIAALQAEARAAGMAPGADAPLPIPPPPPRK